MDIESILTPRLKTIAESVPVGSAIVDVGTDHGYIPIYLCKKNMIQKGLAMDLRRGPLLRAKQNIERFGLSMQIQTRLSDGLQALKPNEADTAIIAGMGGLLIAHILEEAPFFLKHYILQPMTATAELRAWLEANGYRILDERLAREEHKIYTVMYVCRGTMKISQPVHYLVGESFMQNRDPLTPLLIENLLRKFEQTLQGLEKANRLDLEDKKAETKQMIRDLKTLQKECETWSN